MRGMQRRYLKILFVSLALSGLLIACGPQEEIEVPFFPGEPAEPIETASLFPTDPPPPAETLVVCLRQEPESLYRYSLEYLYGATSQAADAVLEAVYDGPIQVRGYQFEPIILEKLPSLSDGDAQIEQVLVTEDEAYYNPDTRQPDNLEIGDRYLPAGCGSTDCIRTYGGGEVAMDQLVAEFRLLPTVTWSDGEPVRASDSVFSFEVDADLSTPTPKTLVSLTASYTALDERTVRWTGLPGFMDSEFNSNFWSPLPAHLLEGLGADSLLTAESTNRMPIGWGPYVIDRWIPGQSIRMIPNPNYFRAVEGLPAFDVLLFRFIGVDAEQGIEQLLTQECDLLDESAVAGAFDRLAIDQATLEVLVGLESQGILGLAWSPGAEFERLDFGIQPVVSAQLPPVFADVRVRQAVAECIDREGIVQEVLLGFSELTDTYLPRSHPLHAAPSEPLSEDVDGAVALLESVGWIDHDFDPATPRRARGVLGVLDGTVLQIAHLTTDSGFHRAVAERLQSDLARCGIEISSNFEPVAVVFQPWPAGPVFGRQFQTVSWAWPSWVSPICEMFHSRNIPQDETPDGFNASGFRNAAFDYACDTMLLSNPEGEAYAEAARTTQEIFAESLPVVPLYLRPRVVAHRVDLCGVEVDPAAFSVLWSIETFYRSQSCEGLP